MVDLNGWMGGLMNECMGARAGGQAGRAGGRAMVPRAEARGKGWERAKGQVLDPDGRRQRQSRTLFDKRDNWL